MSINAPGSGQPSKTSLLDFSGSAGNGKDIQFSDVRFSQPSKTSLLDFSGPVGNGKDIQFSTAKSVPTQTVDVTSLRPQDRRTVYGAYYKAMAEAFNRPADFPNLSQEKKLLYGAYYKAMAEEFGQVKPR